MIILYKGQPEAWGGVYQILQNRLPGLGRELNLRCQPDDHFIDQHDVEVLIPTAAKVDDIALAKMPHLRLVQQAGAGVEGIDLLAARARNIPVANVPTDVSGAAQAVAEHALGMMLALARRHRDYRAALERRCLGTPVGSSLFGKTIGIVGFGRIGRHLAMLLEPFRVSIVAISRTGIGPAVGSHVRWVRPAADLPYLLREAEIIVLACPLDSATSSMLGRNALRMCKRGVCIINVARGAILDAEAALDALREGHISSLGLDVFESEPPDPASALLTHPNTLASPHVASATAEVAEATAQVVAENIDRVSRNLAPLYRVASC